MRECQEHRVYVAGLAAIECVFFCNEASLLNVGIGSRKKVDLKNEDMNECLPHSLTLSSLYLH